ncbi:MAG TPA: GAF domain-containing protein, partial [Candidatus Limnocylindrales bacterium]|nr:GAF domain-containing protein [Candidatus Limnocylindrales bacterium]
MTKAARLLGVHPNTVRAWSDAGRLRYYRINPRGDRRYRLGDLQRFLAAAENVPDIGAPQGPPGAAASWHRRGPGGAGGLGAPDRAIEPPPQQPSFERERMRHRADVASIAALGRIAADPETMDEVLREAVLIIRQRGSFPSVAIYEHRNDRFLPRATAPSIRLPDQPQAFGTLGAAWDRALAGEPEPVEGDGFGGIGDVPAGLREIAIAIAGAHGPWGVLRILADPAGDATALDSSFLIEVSALIASIVDAAKRADEIAHQLHRADALRRVASDIGSRLDLDRILAGLVDHAMVLFNGDRAAVFLRAPDGRATAEVARGLSQAYLQAVIDFPTESLPALAAASRQPMYATHYRDDPRAGGVRAAVVQEGFDTLSTAPLFDGSELLGVLNVYHDQPHAWTNDELETMAVLAEQASIAIKNAQNFEKMATWAAQLQSIQQLGARLSRLGDEREIGLAIATELRQLIDYHNVRVYRLRGEDLIPVAMQGQVGEYIDETPEQLAVK